MKKHISITDPLLRSVGELAERSGIRVFVVGGYVRDLLLDKTVKDIDIVVLGSGISFAEHVAKMLGKTNLVTFPKFGTAMLQWESLKLEIVGARRESYDASSRKPAVEQGSLEEDLSRRDFTVNAIAAAISGREAGVLIDPFGGQSDLKKKILRTPLDPEATFSDDPLRMMRAARFAAQLEFEVDSRVLRAAEAMRDRLKIVSQERISEEFLKLMQAPVPSLGLNILYETGMMKIVFPEVAQLAGVEQRKEYHHKDVFRHTLKVVDNICRESDSVWLRLAALLHDIAKPRTKSFKEDIGWTFHGHEELGARMVKSIFRRMKLPLEQVAYVEKLVRLHLRPMALVDEDVTDSAVRRLLFEAGPEVDDLMKLCRADITSKNPRLVSQVRTNYERVAAKMVEVEERDKMRNWRPALNGDEIMALCGLEPGRLVGDLKQSVVDAILDGKIPNEPDAARAYLMKIKDDIIANAAKQTGKRVRRPAL